MFLKWYHLTTWTNGGIAQLARAPALQAGGHRFESDYLHHTTVVKVAKTKI